MSTLQAKPQLDAISYGADSLELAARYTRASYRQTFNVQAPVFNASKVLKRWSILSGVPLTLGHWEFPAPDSKEFPVYTTKTYTPTELQAVNLPGTFDYPKWVPAPSDAYTLEGAFHSRVALNPEALSTQAQAHQIVNELIAAGWKVEDVEQNEYAGVFTIFYEPTENRRVWTITVNGVRRTVGLMLREKYAAGVGAPGKWSLPSDGSDPVWHSSIAQSSEYGVGEEPIPQRTLLPNEKWEPDQFAGWRVARTDKKPVDTGAGASVEVITKLDNIEAGIGQILGILGAR